ncbi:hypothetical protein KVR01_012258 [Diaporthe batatas]|uniref:uncharacterized protein n=1 Tax=Diaporthe batatas TaxID=748121 RepID=UPI001D0409E0|nr:uncharacterized protein KVR01_012258 [Diaporthe batatas]KAG8157986.1 hypothetical protein KVR01_012258 [Diaporthe batatas]
MSLISHRTLRRWGPNSITRRLPVIAASTHYPSTLKSCLTPNLTVGPLPASCSEAVLAQRRSFHPTSARRIHVIDLDQIALCCLGAAVTVFVFRLFTGYSTLPPHTWARTAHQKTRREVEATTGMAFNMARSAPEHQRHAKFREATFHVPHQLARLNKEAPRFRLEDLGPMSLGKVPWATPSQPISINGPPLDAKTDTRAFLYFPDGSPKATAVFLAINSDLMYPTKAWMQSPPIDPAVAWSRKPMLVMAAFGIVYADWEKNRPSVTGRIVETSRLPVICNFRENVFACIFYPVRKVTLNERMGLTPLDVTDFDLKTSYF